MTNRLDDRREFEPYETRHIMFLILLKLYSRRDKERQLWYHKEGGLCQLMRFYQIPYVVEKGKVWFDQEPVPLVKLLRRYDPKIDRFLTHNVPKFLLDRLGPSEWAAVRDYHKLNLNASACASSKVLKTPRRL